MKIFTSIHKSFERVGIYRNGATENYSVNLKNYIHLTILALNAFFVIMFLGLGAEYFGESCESFYYGVTAITNFIILMQLTRNALKIFKLILNFENTIEKRLDNPSSKLIYEQMNAKVENRTELLPLSIITVTLPVIMVPNLIISYFLYFTTDLNSEAFRLAFPIWLPFKWRTPFGYILAFIIQYAEMYSVVSDSNAFMCFLVGSCEALQSISVDVRNDFIALNNMKKIKKNATKLKKKITEFAQFHRSVRQLSNAFGHDFSEIYEIIITATLMWSILTICSTILIVQGEFNSGNLIQLLRPLTLMFWSYTVTFVLCDWGEQVSNHLESVTDVIYISEWYSFPTEHQKMLLTIMTATKHPVFFCGFGNILLTRNTFKKITKAGFSYSMMFREFID